MNENSNVEQIAVREVPRADVLIFFGVERLEMKRSKSFPVWSLPRQARVEQLNVHEEDLVFVFGGDGDEIANAINRSLESGQMEHAFLAEDARVEVCGR